MKTLLALMLLASAGHAEQALTTTAAAGMSGTADAAAAPATAAPVSVSSIAQAWGHSGFLYSFSLSKWYLFNSYPLGYTPFEIGYDFGNGFRAQTGIDLLFYVGSDIDSRHPETNVQNYSYEMTNWRTSLYYRMPLPIRLRPVLGLSVNAVGGSRRLVPDFEGGKDINADASKFDAWSYIGLGTQLGLEYLLNADWSVMLSGRYDFTFDTVPSPIVEQLSLAVTF